MKPLPEPPVPPSLHLIAPVSVEPLAEMTCWRLFQVRSPAGQRTRHLVGRASGEGRVCSALVSIDVMAMAALTRSGRVYRLRPPTGFDPDAEFVWRVWLGATGSTHVRDVTRALLGLRRLRWLRELQRKRGMAMLVPFLEDGDVGAPGATLYGHHHDALDSSSRWRAQGFRTYGVGLRGITAIDPDGMARVVVSGELDHARGGRLR